LTLTVFWIFGVIAMGSALLCITRKNPIACALWLVVTLFALAALFVLLDAQFIAVLQVLVYAGAIMVLFLFVIMLLNLGRPGPTDIKGPQQLIHCKAIGSDQLGEPTPCNTPHQFELPEAEMRMHDAQRDCEVPISHRFDEGNVVLVPVDHDLLLERQGLPW